MKPKQKIYITGGAATPFIGKHHPDFIWKGHPDYGKRQNPTLEEIIRKVGIEAMENVGVKGGILTAA
jgi:acetyl-CoA acyltransferase